MQFGIHLLGLGRRASVEDFMSAAQAAEDLGYHSVWINDHVVIPADFSSPYPYSADGRPSRQTTLFMIRLCCSPLWPHKQRRSNWELVLQ